MILNNFPFIKLVKYLKGSVTHGVTLGAVYGTRTFKIRKTEALKFSHLKTN